MQLADILYACDCITGISTIPARVYEGSKLIKAYGLEDICIDPLVPYEEAVLAKEGSISYYCTPFYQIYGLVRHGEFIMIFGPVGQTEYTNQEKRDYAFTLGISPMAFDQVLTRMRQIPVFTLDSFLHLLLLINFYFNGEKKDIAEIAAFLHINDDSSIYARPSKPDIMQTEDQQQNVTSHHTRAYEKEMLNLVREGDVTGLQSFFKSRIVSGVGSLSHQQIRQQKNLFIVAATLISRAAMEGGLYEDEAYGLSDMYIRRCEELFSMEAIVKLRYEMALDFTRRVFAIGSQTSLSPLVASVVTYIRQNISADLSCTTLSERFFMNRNLLTKRFKEETGKTLNEFVINERIERAKSLLANTDKSLAEISNYLGFSTQSYFQTQFKRCTGQTPKAYRERQNYGA